VTTIQTDLRMLQQIIRQLSRREREELAEWILNSPDVESAVAESPLPWGPQRHFTVDEYLRFEEESLESHEYVAGYLFAMSTPVVRHEMIVMNLLSQLQSQLRGTPCRAFSSRTKLRLKVLQDDVFYVPDVLVACGPFTDEIQDARWLTEPCLVVEVVSPSTQAIDRREKALNYRHVASLEEYVVIAQQSLEITIFRRSDNWRPLVLTRPEDVFESRAVEVNVALVNIYEGIR
jgi:Uma2 family endonuclease